MKDNKRFWERFASLYTLFMRKNNVSYNQLCTHITPYLKTSNRILELACGTGQFTFRLSPLVNEWVATDYSPKMIQHATQNGVLKNGHFEVADATNLPYKEDSFDIVLIGNALHIMPHPEDAMREIIRVLKPNGLLIAPTFVYDNGRTIAIRLLEKIGFITYSRWTSQSFTEFVNGCGFRSIEQLTIQGKPLNECFLIAESTK